jgi:hypothetical protein
LLDDHSYLMQTSKESTSAKVGKQQKKKKKGKEQAIGNDTSPNSQSNVDIIIHHSSSRGRSEVGSILHQHHWSIRIREWYSEE